MKWKTDEQGNIVQKDGKPVYVHDDGKEISFDLTGTLSTISRLNGEAKSHRERAEGAEEKLKGFEKITDVDAALAALETVGKIKDKKLIESGEVDRVRAEAKAAYDSQLKGIEDKYAPIVKELETTRATLISEKIGGAFAGSKFIADKMAIPPDLVQARFGQLFKLEDGKIVGYDAQGNKLFSRANPGNVADFEEAIEITVDAYPHKEHILKGTGARGGGAGGAGNGGGGAKQMTRAAFDALSPAAKQAHFKSGGAITDA